MKNDECLADVVETQNFASLRVEERYSVPWQVCRVPFSLALASRRFRLAGRGLAFPLAKWVSEVRVVSVSGGRPNGMVHLLVVSVCLVATFAKQPSGLKVQQGKRSTMLFHHRIFTTRLSGFLLSLPLVIHGLFHQSFHTAV